LGAALACFVTTVLAAGSVWAYAQRTTVVASPAHVSDSRNGIVTVDGQQVTVGRPLELGQQFCVASDPTDGRVKEISCEVDWLTLVAPILVYAGGSMIFHFQRVVTRLPYRRRNWAFLV